MESPTEIQARWDRQSAELKDLIQKNLARLSIARNRLDKMTPEEKQKLPSDYSEAINELTS